MLLNVNLVVSRIVALVVLLLPVSSLANQNKLQVVTELSPPYQTLIKNEVSGSATQMVKALLAESDLTSSIHMYPWARAYGKAMSEPNTLIYSIAKSEKRKDLFHWLMPVAYYKFGLVALSERHDLDLSSLSEVSNFVLAVQRNDIAHNWAIDYGLEEGKQLIICSDIGCSWQLLLNKKVDFIVESPELIESMLVDYKLPTDTAKYVVAIPELEITGYLAANINIDSSILEKLQSAIKNNSNELGNRQYKVSQ